MSDALNFFPAPWTIGETETRLAIKSGHKTVAYVQLRPGDQDVAELIIAAPEMFLLLKELEAHVTVQSGTKGEAHAAEGKAIRAKVQSLIAKIEAS